MGEEIQSSTLDFENSEKSGVRGPGLKGTVARDFRPLVFLVNRPHIGSRFTP
jgi:hypothetical protein